MACGEGGGARAGTRCAVRSCRAEGRSPRRSLRPLPLTVACEAPRTAPVTSPLVPSSSALPPLPRPRVAQPRWPLRCPRTRRALAHLGTLPPAAPSAGNVLPSHLFPLLLKRHLILTTTFEAQRALFLRPLAPLPCSAFSSLKQFPLSATPYARLTRHAVSAYGPSASAGTEAL